MKNFQKMLKHFPRNIKKSLKIEVLVQKLKFWFKNGIFGQKQKLYNFGFSEKICLEERKEFPENQKVKKL